MPARTLGAVAIATALVLLPTAAQASDLHGHRTAPAAPQAAARPAGRGVVAAGPSDPASTGPAHYLVVVGLVTLVGGAMLLVLTGRRPDDDEPAD